MFTAFTVAVVLLTILATGAAYFLKSRYQALVNQRKQEYQDEIQTVLESKRFQEQKELVLATGRQIERLQEALNKRILLSSFLSKLSEKTFSGAQWESFRLAEEKISISGNVANFVDLAKVVIAFRQIEELSDVSLVSATLDPESQTVKFSVQASFDKSAFAVKKSTSAENKGIVSSYDSQELPGGTEVSKS